MLTKLHKGATTTPALRRLFQRSTLSTNELARKYGVHWYTVDKWRRREDVCDRSSARHRQKCSITEAEEQVIVELHRRLGLSQDDIAEVLRRGMNAPRSRSAVRRCLVRTGALGEKSKKARTPWQAFADAPAGFAHLDVKHLPALKGKASYVYVAIERGSRYVFADVLYDLKPATVAAFVERMHADYALAENKIRVILTDNGFEWSDRASGKVKPKASGRHAVDVVCRRLGVEHRLTRIRSPQTNGMVERFNRRISEAFAGKEKIGENSGKNCFRTHAERNAFVARVVFNYNRTRLKCLNRQTPLQCLHNQTNTNTKAGIQLPALTS